MLIGPLNDTNDLLKKYAGLYTHIPFMHHEELNSYLNKSDIFILPSYLESWGMVVIEAMSTGLPVIVTENTGAKDAVIQGCGKIIAAGDINALKNCINFFYENRTELETMGKKARQQALNFEWNNYYYQINTVINKINFENFPQPREL